MVRASTTHSGLPRHAHVGHDYGGAADLVEDP